MKPVTDDEIAVFFGMMPGRLSDQRCQEIQDAFGGTPKQIGMDFGCHCHTRLRIFDATDQEQARRCAEALGWRFDQRHRIPQCPTCADRGIEIRFGGYSTDGSNYAPLVCPLVPGTTERENWVFVGVENRHLLRARAADCVLAIARHVTLRLTAPRECAETWRVAQRMMAGRARWWTP